MDIVTTMTALGAVFLWQIWRAHRRQEEERRYIRGGAKQWWGQR